MLQGEIFAAEGYAKTTGDVGVCIATSGPGATNLVTGLADALLDSVPMVAITGQVPRKMIGTDAFQETPIVEVTRQITKHNYLVMQIEDLPRYPCLTLTCAVKHRAHIAVDFQDQADLCCCDKVDHTHTPLQLLHSLVAVNCQAYFVSIVKGQLPQRLLHLLSYIVDHL